MPVLEWSDKLSVGVDVIDTDHRVLVDQINMLGDAIAAGDDDIMVASVLNVLIDYTEYHFGREHQMMEATGYTDSPAHLREHRILVNKVQQIQDDYQKGKALGKDVLQFLKVWLTQHILKSDMKFGEHLAAQGATRMVPPPKPHGEVDWSKLSVLVADDHFNFRALMRNILTALGVTNIRDARNGHEALDALAMERADIVLIDDEMERMGGVEFTRHLRRSSGMPDPRTPVILLPSQDITKDYLAAATQAGVHDLLIKPLAPKAVRARIERHLTRPLPFKDVGGQLVPVRQKAG